MTELHTIEVRYEDVDGRHVDVHDAAREGIHRGDSFYVEDGVCDCCGVEKETHVYSEENVVKVSYTDSDHESVSGSNPRDSMMLSFFVEVVFPSILIVGTLIVIGLALTGDVPL